MSLSFALLDPTNDTVLSTLDLSPLEVLSAALLDISVVAHLPQNAITPVEDWQPDTLLSLAQGLRLNLSTIVAAHARLAAQDAPVEALEKLESDLTPDERALLSTEAYQMIPAENGQFRIRFIAPASHAPAAATSMTPEEQDLLAHLDAFESFAQEGKRAGALLRNLSVEMPAQ